MAFARAVGTLTDAARQLCDTARMNRRLLGFIALAVFALSVLAANAALDRWGLVSVGFGLMAPAGVYFAAIPFTARDVGQELAGRVYVFVAIAVGTTLSALVDPSLALASGSAFALAELADFAVYQPLRRRDWTLAVMLSGIVGAVVDSIVFLGLAESLPLTWRGVAGLVWAKFVVTVIAAGFLSPFRKRIVGTEGDSPSRPEPGSPRWYAENYGGL